MITYAIEREDSDYFVKGEDDCDRCDALAIALLLVDIDGESFNEVLCEAHLDEAIMICSGIAP